MIEGIPLFANLHLTKEERKKRTEERKQKEENKKPIDVS